MGEMDEMEGTHLGSRAGPLWHGRDGGVEQLSDGDLYKYRGLAVTGSRVYRTGTDMQVRALISRRPD